MRLVVGRLLVLTGVLFAQGAAAALDDDHAPVLSAPPAIGDILTARGDQLKGVNYIEREFFLEGIARSYVKRGEWNSDGQWGTSPGETAPYKVRLLVRYPAQASKFNGIVLVEWFNVSGQGEAEPDFSGLHEELTREGYGFVGVGAQAAGVNGQSGLKKSNPARYESLRHPGDSYSYDIYSQAGRVLRSPNGSGPLGALGPRVRSLVAAGESQSAGRMVTYVNAVHPVAGVYDGFYIHSRSGGGAALAQDAANKQTIPVPTPARIRTDLKVPVFVIEAETDVPNFLGARQPDTPRLRTWELAGTAHGDLYGLMGGGVRPFNFKCDDDKDPKLSLPINDGPMTYSMRAALRHMRRWIADGTPPPAGQPLVMEGANVQRDPATGLALGGVRTPQVDVPTRTLSGVRAPAGGASFCRLWGRTDPWNGDADQWDGGPGDPSPTPEPVLSRLYGTKAAYLAKFDRAIDAGVKAGFLLKEDKASLRAEAARLWVAPEASR